MRNRHLYDKLYFYVDRTALSPLAYALITCCLQDGGAMITSNVHAVESTHIVCDPSTYSDHLVQRNARYMAIVRPEWVFKTFLMQTLLPVQKFSANPRMIFSTLAIAPGKIEKDPRKVLDGLITHFGGQVVENAEDYEGATHVLCSDESAGSSSTPLMAFGEFSEAETKTQVDAWSEFLAQKPTRLDFTMPASVVAYLSQKAGLSQRFMVNYNWLEESVRKQTRLSEDLYAVIKTKSHPYVAKKTSKSILIEELGLETCVRAYSSVNKADDLSLARKPSADRMQLLQNAVTGAIVLLAQHLAPALKEKIAEVLKSAKAKVATVPLGDSYQEIVRKVVANASFVICRCQGGFEYEEAQRQEKRIMSVDWVLGGPAAYDMSPVDGAAVYRPFKSCGGIRGMDRLVITLSGYNSRTRPTREDVQVAIQATGACVLPVLSRTHSTHLLCYEAKGEKYKKAVSWGFRNVVDHRWLFDCLTKWSYEPEDCYLLTETSKPVVKKPEETPATNHVDDVLSETLAPSKSSVQTAAAGRFDVDDVLCELDGKSPIGHQTNGLQSPPPVMMNETSSKLFDTPTAKKRRNDKDDTEPNVNFDFKFCQTPDKKEEKPEADADEPMDVTMQVDKTLALADDTVNEKENNVPETKAKASAQKPRREKKTKENDKEKAASRKRKEKAGVHEASAAEISDTTKSKKRKSTISKPTARRRFLLTGSSEECAINESIVLSLHGDVSHTGRQYDPECTHIICSELKRTEKFVAGCSAGKWILKPSYLEASAAAGHFVSEQDHEWGPIDVDKMDTRIWPEAPRYWRMHRQTKGAFDGWRFLIHPKAVPPPDMCERVVQASGGEVVLLERSMDFNALKQMETNTTPLVALVTSSNLPPRDAWMKKFKTHHIKCVNASFLIDYITKDPSKRPAIEDYML